MALVESLPDAPFAHSSAARAAEPAMDRRGLPVVDLSRWRGGEDERAALAAEVREICHEIGFFELVGHGVDPAERAAYLDQLERFFALPEATKASIEKARSPHFRGWERLGSELTDNKVDHREQLDLLTEHAPRDPASLPAHLRLDGPNQWLPEDVLPGFRETVEGFIARLEGVAREVMQVLSAALGLDPGYLDAYFGERPMAMVKLIHYPQTPPGEAGVNAHNDTGFVTLLMQHEVGGLEVESPAGGWIPVPVRDDAFVVNLGETLQRLTGNFFVATNHRVISHADRFSSAYFAGPDLRTELRPLPLAPALAEAVAASPRHRDAGFMARREELLAGASGTRSTSSEVYGEQLWNYYVRSYPDVVAVHHPDVVG